MTEESKKPWYADGLRFGCRACGGCCGGFPGYVWLSEEEAEALARKLGLAREEFLAQYANRVRGRYTLREVENWNCVLLEGGRCVAYEARPVQCRTFPFWNENLRTRSAWNAAARGCPGMDTGRLHTFEEIERLRCMRHARAT